MPADECCAEWAAHVELNSPLLVGSEPVGRREQGAAEPSNFSLRAYYWPRSCLLGALSRWRAEQVVNGMYLAPHEKQLLASQHFAWLPSVDDLSDVILTPHAPLLRPQF